MKDLVYLCVQCFLKTLFYFILGRAAAGHSLAELTILTVARAVASIGTQHVPVNEAVALVRVGDFAIVFAACADIPKDFTPHEEYDYSPSNSVQRTRGGRRSDGRYRMAISGSQFYCIFD